MPSQFAWTILQQGQLPLRPNGSVRPGVEHRCTTTLVWPAECPPDVGNTLMIDPCFTAEGFAQAEKVLGERGISFADIGHVFVTHAHADHMVHIPNGAQMGSYRMFRPITRPDVFAAIEAQTCPGHHPMQQALHFEDPEGRRVWVTGDAVLNEEWLRGWSYFWPNGYGPQQIVETWRSVAHIISHADIIVPGHDAPLTVTAEMVSDLLDSFPQADYASHCPDVIAALRARLARFERGDVPPGNGTQRGPYHLLSLR